MVLPCRGRDHGGVPERSPHAHEKWRGRSPIAHRPGPIRAVRLPGSGDGRIDGGRQGETRLALRGRADGGVFHHPDEGETGPSIPATVKGPRKIWDGTRAVDL